MLAALGFSHQFPREVMALIAQKEGRQFAQALAAIANNDHSAAMKREYIESICAAVSPNTMNTIRGLGYQHISLDQVIDISKQEGRTFRVSIRNLALSGTTASDARHYLNQVLSLGTDSGMFNFSLPADSLYEQDNQHQPLAPEDRPKPEVADRQPTQRSKTPTVQSTDVAPDRAQTQFESFHIYGGKNAFCFSKDTTVGDGKPTVRIEAARRAANGQVLWGNKVGFQLRVAELPIVYGVFAGYLPKLELSGHGKQNKKALVIEDQSDKYFLSIRTRGQEPFAVPAPSAEVFLPMSMIWRQLQANTPDVEQSVLTNIIKTVCEKYQRQLSK